LLLLLPRLCQPLQRAFPQISLHTLSLTTLSSSSLTKTPKLSTSSFVTSYRNNLYYLRAFHILNPITNSKNKPSSPGTVDHVLATIDVLKSKFFTDPDFT
jgi:hypothetical protein